MEKCKVRFRVNGESHEIDVKPSETLLETLRDAGIDRSEGRLRPRRMWELYGAS